MKGVKRKTRHYYSGGYSAGWWKRVGKLKGTDHAAVYALGCALQNLEAYVLDQLKMAEQVVVRTKR